MSNTPKTAPSASPANGSKSDSDKELMETIDTPDTQGDERLARASERSGTVSGRTSDEQGTA